jgi:hypothetical protein
MRRIPPVLLLTPLLAAVFPAWMASCSTPSAGPPDAGPSSDGGDAGDAGDADHTGDAPDHADVTDAPVEASGEAGWVPVSWKAPCEVQVALHPEFAVPKLSWQPCPGNSPGCEAAIVNWEKGKGPPFAAATTVPWGDGYRVGAYMNYANSESRAAVFDTDGSPVAAWRAETSCQLIVPRVGPANVWFGTQGATLSAYLVAPYENIASATEVIALTKQEQDIDSNDTTLSLEGLTGTTISIYDSLGKVETSFGPPPGLGYILAHPVNDSAFMLFFPAFEKPEAWIWNRSTHTTQPLIQPAPEFVLDIRSDGETLVWLQVPAKAELDPAFPPGWLWTSPFATSKADLKPSKRRSIPSIPGTTSAVGQGFYAMFGGTADRKIHVYRLSDAQHWAFVPPQELSDIRKVSYVDAKTVWYWTVTGIYRQAIDALGPGDPPP